MAKKFGYDCPDFRGGELEFRKRADQSNINKLDAKRFWQGENVVYDVELRSIESYTKSTLDSFFRAKRDSEVSSKELESMWDSIRNQIAGYYTKYDESGGQLLTPNKEKYIQRTLKKSYGLGPAFNILLWLAICLEILVIVIQTVAMSIAEGGFIDIPAIVIAIFMGILLAIGGWLVGMFLASWWFEHELDKNQISEMHIGPKDWAIFAIGIVLILFVGLARMFAGGGIYALIVSIVLGSLVAILKGFKDYFEGMRCFMGSFRFAYFKKEASRMHEDRLKDYYQMFTDIARETAGRYNVIIKEEG